jgi:hypothetical protein
MGWQQNLWDRSCLVCYEQQDSSLILITMMRLDCFLSQQTIIVCCDQDSVQRTPINNRWKKNIEYPWFHKLCHSFRQGKEMKRLARNKRIRRYVCLLCSACW